VTGERGALSIVLMCGSLVFCLFALCLADLGAMLVARSRAQAAADAAVLAAVRQQIPALAGDGESPEDAARATAAVNGATLIRCACSAGEADAEVHVESPAKPVLIKAWFDRPARATARAQADPDVLSYRAEP
jgi:Flp pilus assembly protein TadG